MEEISPLNSIFDGFNALKSVFALITPNLESSVSFPILISFAVICPLVASFLCMISMAIVPSSVCTEPAKYSLLSIDFDSPEISISPNLKSISGIFTLGSLSQIAFMLLPFVLKTNLLIYQLRNEEYLRICMFVFIAKRLLISRTEILFMYMSFPKP